jgi:acetyl esterase/lipase
MNAPIERLCNGLGVLALCLGADLSYSLDLESVPTAESAVLDDRYPATEVRFADGVTGLPNVVYATVPGFQPLKLDLYLPPDGGDPSVRYPAVLMIHGGGWQSGHSRHSGAFADWPGTLAALAGEGYVVASINYRLSGEAPFPAAIQDVKSAVLFLKANADNYPVDPERIVTWGGSAGGQLAALAAVSCGMSELGPAADIPGWNETTTLSDCVRAAVVWYGVFDFADLLAEQEMPAPPVAAYLGCQQRCPDDTVRLASPLMFLDANDPPMLLIHGTEDSVVPVRQSEQFDAAAKKLGARTDLILIPGVDHSFVGKDFASTRAASLEALGASMEFLRQVTSN